MNSEVIKAMNRQEKPENWTKKVKKWWNKNGYKVMRIVLFPVWITGVIIEKYNAWRNAQQTWTDTRADEILSYYIPRYSDWDTESKTFYYFNNGYGWHIASAKKHLKRKDRRFWNVYKGVWGGQLREYLLSQFELEGFTKEIGNCSEGWTEITFHLKDENLEVKL